MFGIFAPTRNIVFDEACKVRCCHLMRKLKVDTAFYLLDIEAPFMHITFQDKLFQEIESPFVIDLLAHLDLRFPKMWRISFFAIATLLVLDIKVENQRFFKHGFFEDFFSNSHSHLKAFGMWLGPNKRSICKLQLLGKAFDLFQTMVE